MLSPDHLDDLIGEDIRPSWMPIVVLRNEGHIHAWNVGLILDSSAALPVQHFFLAYHRFNKCAAESRPPPLSVP